MPGVSIVDNHIGSRHLCSSLNILSKADAQIQDIPHCEEDRFHQKLMYVRYADDFMLALVGPKSLAYGLLCQIANFLGACLGMTLNIEKSGVKHHEKGVMFLGYHIRGNCGLNSKLTEGRDQRVGDAVLRLGIPLSRLFDRFTDRGVFQVGRKTKSSRFVGRRVDKWLFLGSDYEVIIRFNSVIQGIANYYSASTQKDVLGKF